MRSSLLLLTLFAFASVLPVSAEAVATSGPFINYSKSFPASVPAYTGITVSKSGDGSYVEDPKDDDPLKFHLTATEVDDIFTLAGKLDHFSKPLESGAKVANMGIKTFRYEDTDGSHEVKFNYSENPDAQALSDWFEKIAETERALALLQRSVRFDKLGVQDAILRIEVLRNQKRLTAADQFLPLLDRVIRNETFLHIARDRAGVLADSIRGNAGSDK